MGLIWLRSRHAGGNRLRRAAPRTVMTSAIAAILPLLMPAILFAGILFGLATPTEVSSFAIVYGLILSCIVYRELDLATLLRTVLDSAMLAGMVLFILAAASGFSWALTVAYLPQRLVISCTASTMTPRCSSSARSRCSSWLARCWKCSLPSSCWRRCCCRSPAASG